MKSVRIRLMDRSRVSRNQAVRCLGRDVLLSSIMQEEKAFLHHGSVNCYDHSVSVAQMSLLLAQKLRVKVDAESLVRGALLHDLYLYDWHVSDPRHPHRLHGFFHPSRALQNAERHFRLNSLERDIILRHMFPLTVLPPLCRESWLVCAADTICAVQEWIHTRKGEKGP